MMQHKKEVIKIEKILTIYCESDGLMGNVFSVAVLLTDETGAEVEDKVFVNRSARVSDFYANSIYKNLKSTNIIEVSSLTELMQEFSKFYKPIKDNYKVLYHTGEVVETGFFRDLVKGKYIEPSDLPYLPIELSSILQFLGEDANNVEVFNKKYDIVVGGDISDPVFDCRKTYACYKFIEHNLISLKFSEDQVI